MDTDVIPVGPCWPSRDELRAEGVDPDTGVPVEVGCGCDEPDCPECPPWIDPAYENAGGK